MRVAIQGLRGSFHHQAALKLLPDANFELLECMTFREVFAAVQTGEAAYGVVATHNNVYGPIDDVETLLAAQPISIIGNTELHIDQYLIGHRAYSSKELQHNHVRILSQPPALAQAADWLEHNLTDYELCEAADTAASVRRVTSDHADFQLAVAGKHAAELYGGTIVAGPLNSGQNSTQFILFQR